MIAFWNRKEIMLTNSLEEQMRVRDRLAAAKIDYEVRAMDRTSPTALPGGTRARFGTAGHDMDVAKQYRICVRKKDYEAAQRVIYAINQKSHG